MSWEYEVTFLMPVYNGEAFVADAIESVRSQTMDAVQLVVVNDGSTDDSEAIVEQYLPDEDIVYVSQTNRGATAAVNTAMRLADGRYVGVHPQDDVSLPDRAERQADVLDRHPEAGFVYAPAVFVDLDGEAHATWGDWRGEGLLDSEDVFRELYVNGMFIASPAVLFRRDHVTDHRHPWGDPDLRIVSDDGYAVCVEVPDALDALIALRRDEVRLADAEAYPTRFVGPSVAGERCVKGRVRIETDALAGEDDPAELEALALDDPGYG